MTRNAYRRHHKDKTASLLDRFGMAVLSGTLAFLSALAIWGLITSGRYNSGLVPPFEPVLWFTVAMTGVGFLTAESLLVTIFGKVWYVVYILFNEEEPPNQS